MPYSFEPAGHQLYYRGKRGGNQIRLTVARYKTGKIKEGKVYFNSLVCSLLDLHRGMYLAVYFDLNAQVVALKKVPEPVQGVPVLTLHSREGYSNSLYANSVSLAHLAVDGFKYPAGMLDYDVDDDFIILKKPEGGSNDQPEE